MSPYCDTIIRGTADVVDNIGVSRSSRVVPGFLPAGTSRPNVREFRR